MTPQEEIELYKCFTSCLSRQVLMLFQSEWIPEWAKEQTNQDLQKLMQPYEHLREEMKIGRG